MNKSYQYKIYDYEPCFEQRMGEIVRHPVIVIGGGPTGLTAANDLARRGIKVVLIDAENRVSEGSRAICFAKRSLEVFDRLGVVRPMREKGVTWNVGRIFYKQDEVYRFNLLPEDGHAHPAFINLQQYYVEQYLIEGLEEEPNAEIRWLSEVIDVQPLDDSVRLTVQTPDGTYETEADWVIAADGARSVTRRKLGLDWKGVCFEDKFLIADVLMKSEFPAERWFWFAPSFGSGHSALLHMQPDNIWRIDFQLGRNADPVEEVKLERVIPRIQAMLGEDVPFDLEWVSVYSFSSRKLDNFVHGRVIFAGDAAHLMSVFGARGANSGIQDVDNLVWKLTLVLEGQAPPALLDSYSVERVYAAEENLLYTASSVEFISPSGPGALALRNAVLELSQEYDFARPLINSGRLSTATVMADSPLNTRDEDVFDTPLVPGSPCPDAPVTLAGEPAYLLKLLGWSFNGLWHLEEMGSVSAETIAQLKLLESAQIPIKTLIVTNQATTQPTLHGFPVIHDADGYVQQRFDMQNGTYYLSRPDQCVCARWKTFNLEKVQAALARASCLWRDSRDRDEEYGQTENRTQHRQSRRILQSPH